MGKDRLRKSFGFRVFLIYVTLALTFGLYIKPNIAYANDESAGQEISKIDRDLSNVEFLNRNVAVDGKVHNIYATNLPKGVRVVGYYGNGVAAEGSHLITLLLENYGEDAEKYNEIPPMTAILRIVGKKDPNKLNYDESTIRFVNRTFKYDGKEHSIFVTGVPEGVTVTYTGNKKIAEGVYIVTAHFEGAEEYNVILDRIAIMTIETPEKSSRKAKVEFRPEEKPGVEEQPKPEEKPGVEEMPEPEEKPGVEEQPKPEEKPGDEEQPKPEEKPGDEEQPKPEEKPGDEEQPKPEEKPGDEEQPKPEEKPGDEEQPKPEEKPGDEEQPDPEEKPGDEEQPKPEEEHIWEDWISKNDKEHERECSHCGIKQTQAHDFVFIGTTFEDNQDGTHVVKETYSCTICNFIHNVYSIEEHKYSDEIEITDNQDGTHTIKTTYCCTDCQSTYEDTKQEDCEYGSDWQYIGNNLEAVYCTICNHSQTRVHEHEEEPEGLEYICKSSNGDGTHKLEASYICGICSDTVTVNKDEDCDYEISYNQTGINDTHIEVSDCKICHDHKEKQGRCVPVGDLQLIKVYSQIYEYYDCGLCGDWCERIYHTVHRYGDWEERDSQTHIRYCICIEEREIADHVFQYEEDGDTGTFTCEECGYTKTVAKHDHGYGVYDEMSLMELISSPAYDELVSKSQIANPNPSPYDYCSRYDFICHTCGVKYSVYYAHKFKDGVCTRTGYCGGIEEPAEASMFLELADMPEEVEKPEEEEKAPEEEVVDDEPEEEEKAPEEEVVDDEPEEEGKAPEEEVVDDEPEEEEKAPEEEVGKPEEEEKAPEEEVEKPEEEKKAPEEESEKPEEEEKAPEEEVEKPEEEEKASEEEVEKPEEEEKAPEEEVGKPEEEEKAPEEEVEKPEEEEKAPEEEVDETESEEKVEV